MYWIRGTKSYLKYLKLLIFSFHIILLTRTQMLVLTQTLDPEGSISVDDIFGTTQSPNITQSQRLPQPPTEAEMSVISEVELSGYAFSPQSFSKVGLMIFLLICSFCLELFWSVYVTVMLGR